LDGNPRAALGAMGLNKQVQTMLRPGALTVIAALVILMGMMGLRAAGAEPPVERGDADLNGWLYPDLRTFPASDPELGTEVMGGAVHHVVRFSTMVWNAGDGPLELRGDSSSGATQVYQRVYDRAGNQLDLLAGTFVYHEGHQHWHFENFARHELWTRASYDRWLANGRNEGSPEWLGSKTTGQGESFCMRDSLPVGQQAGVPGGPIYDECGTGRQGISMGWADAYTRDMVDQWVDIGLAPLSDGEYVLRLVADPQNLIYESDQRADLQRESQGANEAMTAFTISEGRIARVGLP
jgi:hypothetical protein